MGEVCPVARQRKCLTGSYRKDRFLGVGSKAAKALAIKRWAKTTKKQRSAHARMMNDARWGAKRRAEVEAEIEAAAQAERERMAAMEGK